MSTNANTLLTYAMVAVLLLHFDLVSAKDDGAGLAGVPDTIVESLDARDVLIIGEVHGTKETPAIVAALMDLKSKEGMVLLGLEIPANQQGLMDDYLSGAGSEESLLSGDFWKREAGRQDGRSSQAIFDLVREARRLRLAGRRIEVVCYVPSDREVQMGGSRAQNILSTHDRVKPDFTLVLSGNYHSRVVKADFDDQEPLGAQLSRLDSVSLPVYSTRGEYWACGGSPVPDCGVRSVSDQAHSLKQGVMLSEEITGRGYHGSIVIEEFTASPPVELRTSSPGVPR